MQLYNRIATYEVEGSEIRFNSRHSADLIMAPSSRKSARIELMDVILLHIFDKITVCSSCQSIDIGVSHRL
jgi:hypothetical protein